MESLTEHLKSKSEQLIDADNRVADLEVELTDARREAYEVANRLEEVNASNGNLRQEKEVLFAANHKAHQEGQALQRSLDELMFERGAKEQQDIRAQEMLLEFEDMKADFNHIVQSKCDLENELATKEAQLREVSERLKEERIVADKRLDEARRDAKEMVGSAESRVKMASDRKAEIEAHSRNVSMELERLRRENAGLNSEMSTKEKKIAVLQSEIDILKEKEKAMESLENEIMERRNMTERMQKKIRDLEKGKEKLMDEAMRAKDENIRTMNSYNACLGEMQELREANTRKDVEVQNA